MYYYHQVRVCMLHSLKGKIQPWEDDSTDEIMEVLTVVASRSSSAVERDWRGFLTMESLSAPRALSVSSLLYLKQFGTEVYSSGSSQSLSHLFALFEE